MTERERLMENYEDAYFAVLMYDICRRQGQRLIAENERLKAAPEHSAPESAWKRAMRTIDSSFRRQKSIRALKQSKKLFAAVASVFMIMSAMFTAVYAAVPEVQAGTLNLLIKMSDVSSEFMMVPEGSAAESSEEGDILMGYRIPPMPQGYELVNTSMVDEDIATNYYKDKNNDFIRFSISVGIEHSYNIDTEDIDFIEEIAINGNKGLLTGKDGVHHATLADLENEHYVDIACSNLTHEEMINILKSTERIE